MAKRIYVGNLPWAYSNTDLEALFKQYGDVAAAEVAGGQTARLRQVVPVDPDVAPAGDARVEDMRPRAAGVRAGEGDVRLAVDRVVDRFTQRQVVLEQVVRHVHGQVAGAVHGLQDLLP